MEPVTPHVRTPVIRAERVVGGEGQGGEHKAGVFGRGRKAVTPAVLFCSHHPHTSHATAAQGQTLQRRC